MPAASSGKPKRLPARRKPHAQTSSSKQHRFESFTTRIAKLSIRPLAKSRGLNDVAPDSDSRTTHFRHSLEKWRDMNLSAHFSTFVREIDPLCESLELILLHQEQIVKILLDNIADCNPLSLEPLLDLFSSLAHDLGPRFEPFFLRSLTEVKTIVMKQHVDVDVLEWSFEALAWMFHYLSKLLVPNLRPTFDVMMPLLGKDQVKAHIARFAAEALAFLIRKAAAVYVKNPEPLDKIMVHILHDSDAVDDGAIPLDTFEYGLMNLFAESIKGVNHGLHSSGPAVFEALVRYADNSAARRVAVGVFVNVLHHVSADTSGPLLEAVHNQASIPAASAPTNHDLLIASLIFHAATVRDGSRIAKWELVLDTVSTLLVTPLVTSTSVSNPELEEEIQRASIAVFGQAPIPLIYSQINHLKSLIKPSNQRFSLPAIACFNQLYPDRFSLLSRSKLQSYFSAQSMSRNELCLLLLHLSKVAKVSSAGRLAEGWVSEDWVKSTMALSEDSSVCSEEKVYCQNAILEAGLVPPTEFMEALRDAVEDTLSAAPQDTIHTSFILGKGLESILDVPNLHVPSDWSRISSLSFIWNMPVFLENIGKLCKNEKGLLQILLREDITQRLIKNLSSPSRNLRVSSLSLLQATYRSGSQTIPPFFDTALAIEEIPINHEAVRKIAVHINRIGHQYELATADPILQPAHVNFLFGILTYRLPDIWPAAIDALKSICSHKDGEEAVSSLIFEWLRCHNPDPTQDSKQSQQDHIEATEFQCFKSEAVKRAYAELIEGFTNPLAELKNQFQDTHRKEPTVYADARAQALRILKNIPWLAEKKSRQLVPLFLQWTNYIKMSDHDELAARSSRQERLLALEIFSSFQNPCVLYRASDTYWALIKMLESSEAEFQKRALQAILTWKQPEILELEPILKMIIDDGRFRDGLVELSKVMQTDDTRLNSQHEVMPLLLRILFGRMTASSKRSKMSQMSKRRAVFDTLARFTADTLKNFLEIAVMPLDLVTLDEDKGNVSVTHFDELSYGQKIGIITMVRDMVRFFGDHLLFLNKPLLNIAIVCFESLKRHSLGDDQPETVLQPVRTEVKLGDEAEKSVDSSGDEDGNYDSDDEMVEESKEEIQNDEEDDDNAKEVRPQGNISSLVDFQSQSAPRGPDFGALRRLGIQYLTTIFERLMSPSLQMSAPRIYSALIDDRIEKLAEETAYSVSNLLKLFSTWAADEQAFLFLVYSNSLLFRIVDILRVSPKEEVQLFVFEKILTPFFKRRLNDVEARTFGVPQASGDFPMHDLLEHTLFECHQLLRRGPSRQILPAVIELTTHLASKITELQHAISVVEVSCNLLRQPPSRVKPKTKSDVLSILQQLCSKFKVIEKEFGDIFEAISPLFGYFKDQENRLKLCTIMQLISDNRGEPNLAVVAEFCSGLNSFSASLIDEPDYDRRRETYEAIIGLKPDEIPISHWSPVLHNLVFYIREINELGVGSNACVALCAFVRLAPYDNSLLNLLKEIVLPAIQKGMLSSSEEIRREYLKVMTAIVQEVPMLEDVNDLRGLLMDEDEEANIFNNLLHIQQHRRIRAVRRLASPQICSSLRSANTANFLIPLIEHFIVDREDDSKAGDLAAEAITTIGALAAALEWSQARRLFMKYLRMIGSKPDLERSMIKQLGALIDTIVNATRARDAVDKPNLNGLEDAVDELEFNSVDDMVDESDFNGIEDTVNDISVHKSKSTTLSSTLPDPEKLSIDIANNLLPPLTAFLNHKDENVVSLRIPAAVSAAKLMMVLPQKQLSERLPPMLTDVCHVLRSRTPESRDLVRKALAQITEMIGPSYFGFVLKELRGALQRGYQLHVLSYTMHTLLVEVGPSFAVSTIDHCLSSAVSVIMDDIFGVVGLEKDAEGYTNKMKEVKQSKSFDSMELLAKLVSLESLKFLVQPIQSLLLEKLDLKTVKKVDELLRRLSAGLLKNPTIEDQRTLVFCYELIQKSYKSSEEATKPARNSIAKRLMLNVRGTRGSHTQSGSHFGFKMIRFAFDMVRTVVQKFDSLKTVRYLEGFMPAVGDAVTEGEDEVQMSALRLLAAVMKLPLKALETDGPSYISAAVGIVKNTTNNDADMAQAALKLIAATLRDREDIVVDEADIAYLLKRLQPDLERHDNQGFIFNLLKSVVGREYVVPEVYNIMDTVRAMMVTAQSRETQNMARAVYFQFIMNYPQSEQRQQGQITFLGKNLDYPQVDGRKSVLEAIHRLLSKDGELVQTVIRFLFEPLVFVMIMDESAACRKMANLLLGTCFEKAEEELTRMGNLAKDWLMLDPASSEKEELQVRAALQLYTIWIDKDAARIEPLLSFLCQHISEIFVSVVQDSNDQWALVYYALCLLKKLTEHLPERLLHKQRADLWTTVNGLTSYPHTWVKHASAELLGDYLEQFVAKPQTNPHTLVSARGLVLEETDAQLLTKRSLKTLQIPVLTSELANLTIRNLAILARLFQSAPSSINGGNNGVEGDVVEESGDERQPAKTITELIFHHLSWVIRREPADSKAASLIVKTAALQLCHLLCKETPIETLTPLVQVILRPLHQLSDPNIPTPFSIDENFKSAWKDNVAIAHDIIDTLQKRLGSTAYVQQMSVVQADARARRDERRTKRRIDAVVAPEKALSDKRRRHDRTKERRKEKNQMYRERRRGY